MRGWRLGQAKTDVPRWDETLWIFMKAPAFCSYETLEFPEAEGKCDAGCRKVTLQDAQTGKRGNLGMGVMMQGGMPMRGAFNRPAHRLSPK